MPVRIVSESRNTTPREVEEKPKRRRPRLWHVAALLAVVLLVTAITTAMLNRSHPVSTETPSTSTTDSWPNSTTPASEPPVGSQPIPGVDGLTRGTASVTTGNTGGAMAGIPIGWPQTLDGAVSAAMTYQSATYAPAVLLPKTQKAVQQRLYTAEGLRVSASPADMLAKIRKKLRISDDGKILLNGKVSPKEQLYASGYPRYGAYKLVSHEGPDDQPTLAVTDVWFPFVMGPGTDTKTDELYVGWVRALVEVKWENGDWKINGVRASNTFPMPPDPRRTNQTFQARRDLLGPGWSVLADATEEPLPEAVLTR